MFGAARSRIPARSRFGGAACGRLAVFPSSSRRSVFRVPTLRFLVSETRSAPKSDPIRCLDDRPLRADARTGLRPGQPRGFPRDCLRRPRESPDEPDWLIPFQNKDALALLEQPTDCSAAVRFEPPHVPGPTSTEAEMRLETRGYSSKCKRDITRAINHRQVGFVDNCRKNLITRFRMILNRCIHPAAGVDRRFGRPCPPPPSCISTPHPSSEG